MLSADNVEEFNEMMSKLNDILKKELSSFDYYVVVSLSKAAKDEKDVDNLAFNLSSLTGASPFSTVKLHVGNIVSKVQDLLLEYQLAPTEPLFKPTEGGKK